MSEPSLQLITLRRRDSDESAHDPGPGAVVPAVPVTKRAFIETYGCQMNIGDSEIMGGALAACGYVAVSDPADADVIVVNTCAIRDHAERRVLGRIGQLQKYRRNRPDLVLAVTGCMAQRIGEGLLSSVSGVDIVAGPDSYRSLGDLIEDIRAGDRPRGQALLELDSTENYEGLESTLRREGVTAWVTVQRGCDHRCTFCIVPYVRGPEKNRQPEDVLEDIRAAVREGYSEVTLLGQTVNSYVSGDWNFARLLRATARVQGIRRVRFTSPHPNDVSPEMIRVMADEPAVCSQLHLPMQSGSDRILRRMVRRYTVEQFLDTVARVREAVPGIALSTDVIVGFPGEAREDFEATLDLVRQVRFDDAYLYRYSLRDGTPATRFRPEDFVSDDEAQFRLEALIRLQRSIQREIGEAEVGQVREVLVERMARSEGDVLGRTEQNKPVAFPGQREWIGRYRTVRLTASSGATFRGVEVG